MTTKVELPSKDAYELTDALEVLRAAVEAEQEKMQRYQALVNQEEQLLRQRQNEAGAAERQATARHQQLEADHQRKLQREKSTLEDDRKGLLDAEQNFKKRQEEAAELLGQAEAIRKEKEETLTSRLEVQSLKAQASSTFQHANEKMLEAVHEAARVDGRFRQATQLEGKLQKLEVELTARETAVVQRERVAKDQEKNLAAIDKEVTKRLANLKTQEAVFEEKHQAALHTIQQAEEKMKEFTQSREDLQVFSEKLKSQEGQLINLEVSLKQWEKELQIEAQRLKGKSKPTGEPADK